jgi:very-short-patch-repair endonuclease
MYCCKICNKEFENRHSYIGHCSSHSRGENYKKSRAKDKEIKKHICNFCNNEFENGWSLGGHKNFCKENPNREIRIEQIKRNFDCKGSKLSEEHKKKISNSRKKYLDENPGNIPYLLNHSSKESYPERIFREELEKRNIKGWIQEYPIERYSLDFVFLENKLNIEIDGGTHDLPEIIKKDKIRDEKMNSLGFEVLRISAKDIKNDIHSIMELIIKKLLIV